MIRIYTFIVTILITGFCYCQNLDTDEELSKLITIPNSPEAQAFTKYGDPSISMFTGTPDISVPIYTIKGRELSLPINLSYDASGIKVEQLATQVGLGWNLNVGGRISRLINGLPDDYSNASFQYFTFWDDFEVRQPLLKYYANNNLFDDQNDVENYFTFLLDINSSKLDALPDYYSFNALGISDHFVFDVNTLQPIALNNPRLKIELVKDINNSIISWKITSDNGTIFHFNKYETTQSTSADIAANAFNKDYKSSWLLTKIESPNKKDIFDLIYTSTGLWTQPQPATLVQTRSDLLDGDGYITTYPATGGYNVSSEYKIDQQFLTSINYNGKKIISIDLGSRLDTYTNNSVNKITVFRLDQPSNVELKHIDFKYSYFKSNPNITEALVNNNKIRLKLDTITINSPTKKMNQYVFEYDSPNYIAERSSLSQDYLGYFNGKSNTVLYPKIIVGGDIYEGANRSPDFSFAKKGILKKITYPTGGYTEFEYEPNGSPYTNDDISSSVQEVEKANFSLTGGTDQSTPCGLYCQDMYPNPPKVESIIFQIDEAGSYNIDFQNVGTTSNPTFPNDALIFLKSPLKVNLATGQSTCYSTTLDYDEIYDHNTGNLLVSPVWSIFEGNTTLNLDSGCYQIMLVNPNSTKTMSVRVFRDESIDNGTLGTGEVERAGLRINTIKDYSNENILAKEKSYQYKTDLNGTKSSGLIGFSPQLNYYSQILRIDQSETNDWKTDTYLNRVTSSSGGNRPHIGYSKVFELKKNITNSAATNGYIEYTYNFNSLGSGVYSSGIPPNSNNYLLDYSHGKKSEIKVYDNSNQIISKNKTSYSNSNLPNNVSKGIYVDYKGTLLTHQPVVSVSSLDSTKVEYELAKGGIAYIYGPDNKSLRSPCFYLDPNKYTCLPEIFSPLMMRRSNANGSVGYVLKIEKEEYFGDETLFSIIDYNYDSTVDYLLRETKTLNSIGDTLTTKYYYPKDLNVSGASKLVLANRLNEVVKTESFKGNELIYTKKTDYITSLPGPILPSQISFQKDGSSIEDRIHFDFYNNGNIRESYKTGGLKTIYILGYNNSKPIAKIENAAYASITSTQQTLITDVENSSNLDTSLSTENTLRTKLESLRQGFSSSKVTTYTYDPMIGVTSITDPSGYTSYYEYDYFNRLQFIKNKDGEVLEQNRYNYALEALVIQDLGANIPTSVVSGTSVGFTASVIGGSGDFSYEWTVSYGSTTNTYTTTTNTTTVNTTSNYSPSFTITSKVTDNQTLESTTYSEQVTVTQSYPSLSVSKISSNSGTSQSVGNSVTYNITVSGGSGNYQYKWSKTNGQTTINYLTNSSTFRNRVASGDCNSFSIQCKVTDLTTNEVKTKFVSINVVSGCSGQNQ